MKTFNIFRLSNLQHVSGLFLVMLLFVVPAKADSNQAPLNVSFQVFYDELTPYGDWVNDPTHGFVWVPYVDPGFQPYQTNGYWVNSRFGNTWVSLYDWGWAPFHYGRWFFTDYYGWAWVPGYEWAPAWVSWRTGRGYYGWAPLWPSVGVHVSFNFPVNHWVFVPRRRFLARNIYNYYVPQRNVTVIYNQTTVINNTYVYNNNTYVAGPSRDELRRVTRSNVPVYEVSNGRRPGRTVVDNNRVQLYRPELVATGARTNTANARPTRVYTTEEYSSRRAATASTGITNRDNKPEVTNRSDRRAATLPQNTNPRAATSTNRESMSPRTSPTRSTVQRSNENSRYGAVDERNVRSGDSPRVLDERRNATTAPLPRTTTPSQRQRVANQPTSASRQPLPSKGESRRQTSVSPTNSNAQRSMGRTSEITNQRPVASPSGRSSVGSSNRSTRVEGSSSNQRQIASPASRSQGARTQVSRPESRQSSPGVRPSVSSPSRNEVRQPSGQTRSNSGEVNRSAITNGRRGN